MLQAAPVAGAFEGSGSQGLSFNAFLQWSTKVPALLTSLKSLLAAGSVNTGNAAASTSSHVRLILAMLLCLLLLLLNERVMSHLQLSGLRPHC